MPAGNKTDKGERSLPFVDPPHTVHYVTAPARLTLTLSNNVFIDSRWTDLVHLSMTQRIMLANTQHLLTNSKGFQRMSAIIEKKRSETQSSTRWRWGRLVLVVVGVAVLAALVAFASWATTPLQPTAVALAALESDAAVSVTVSDDQIAFAPADEEPDTGVVFYPGGDVDFRAYAAPARAVAENGYLVVVPQVLFNHAVFSPGVAADVIAAYPEIETWVVGGHSLGGAMAAQFAVDQLELVDGVALWGAYPGTDADWSDVPLSFSVVYGTQDGLVSAEEIAAARAQLPADTAFVAIDGGNHAQFGSYGVQEGDNIAAVSAAEQQEAAVAALIAQLDALPTSGK